MILLVTQALAFDPATSSDVSTLPAASDDPVSALVVNGQNEPGFPAAVSLGIGPISVCTGSVITPRIVLTAAHCSADIPIEAVVQFGSVTFGADRREPEHSIQLTDAQFHPDYVPLVPGVTDGEFDLAVAVLAEDAPVEPVLFRTERIRRADEGTRVVSVGFGIDETGEGSSGIKRSAELTVSEVDEMFVISRSNDNGGANICSGDSGGPQYALVDGRWEQWAVHSWADVNCQVYSGSTRTDIAADWILEQVEAVHGTRDLCNANGLYDDGVCDTFCPGFDPDCVAPAQFTASEDAGPRGCATPLNRFCSTGLFIAILALSRRRAV